MTFRSAFLAFICVACATAFATAATPKFVNVPAGELADGLESLARQYGIDIIYPSRQLKGLKTGGINGTLEPRDAFERLLKGTPLVLKEEGSALLITARASRQAERQKPVDTVSEVEINARYAKLSAMREEMMKLEERFYAKYNELNADHQYDIVCRLEAPTGSHIKSYVCRPAFVDEATGVSAGSAMSGNADPSICCAPMYQAFGASSISVILRKWPAYEKNMLDAINKHPELRKLAREREALGKRYEAVRKQKLRGKVLVVD